ncbi:MAG: amphi-Trp domain-containing protein, partial [Clostridia bacterium]|nr:amphi-Trp domain-containing protein [Clostridia bacterium]
MARRELEFKAALTAEQAAELLEQAARSLREGKGTLRVGDRKLALRPARTILVEGEAGAASGRAWLELELEWREGETIEIAPGVAEDEDWEKEDWDEEDDWEDEE